MQPRRFRALLCLETDDQLAFLSLQNPLTSSQVLSGLTAGLRRDDYLRLKQTFHPWIKVDINHFSYRSEEYESLIEAEKLLAQEMEQILERVARLN